MACAVCPQSSFLLSLGDGTIRLVEVQPTNPSPTQQRIESARERIKRGLRFI